MTSRKRKMYEAARAMKRGDAFGSSGEAEPCPECDAAPGAPHASWCEAGVDEPT